LVAVVTGGSSGIGAATVLELARRGARVGIVDRTIPDGGVHAVAVTADITDDAEVARAIDEIANALGGIDILVNNAGFGSVGDITVNQDEEWHRVYDVNVVGIARVTRHALPWLRASGAGAIVNTASIAGTNGLPKRALYSATKGAVIALTYALAADLIDDRIRVNAIAPGTADTPWVQRLLASAENPHDSAAELRDRQPIGRLVTAEEVAFAIANVASPRAASTTGTVLTVDGGLTTLRV
jgi:NAD(P)-dependent dehydrogenase (short-subunit alcohol dehydrogenase family)